MEKRKKKVVDSNGIIYDPPTVITYGVETNQTCEFACNLLHTPITQSEYFVIYGWDGSDFGMFFSAYGWFNVFFLALIFVGVLLDKYGIRFSTVASVITMIAGALLKYFAFKNKFPKDPGTE